MDRELFRQIADDIFTITKIKTVFYDADMNLLYSHPDTMSEFCARVRRLPERTERCLACDRDGFRACRETGEICVYRCHMGLFEVMAPVVEDGEILGYVQFGQMADAGDPTVAEENARREMGGDAQVCELLHLLPQTDEKTVCAMARLIAMCTSYARLKESLGASRDVGAKIERYVINNLKSEKLSVPELCRVFGISRATLYLLSRRHFGMGLSDFIRQKRINKARELLLSTDKTVEEIAESVGVYDANYLTKLLKRYFGKTARQLRRERL